MSEKFKLDAQRMISAHQSRHRPISPESSSNWDSSEPEDDGAPQIEDSSTDEDDRGSVKRSPLNKKPIPTPAVRNGPSKERSLKPEAANKSGSRTPQGGLTPQGGRTPKASPALSLKNSLKPGMNVFVDRSNYNSSDESDNYSGSTAKRRVPRQDEVPPYDFKGVVNGTRGRDQVPPGKTRKGNRYDPPGPNGNSSQELEDDWADSDAEARTLQALRAEMDRNSPNKQTLNNAGPSQQRAKNPSSLSAVELREKQKKNAAGKNKSTSQQELMVAQSPVTGAGLDNPAFGDEFVNANTDDRVSFAFSENEGYIYYFEHGNKRYYDGRGAKSEAFMAEVADKSAVYVRRGLQEFYHALRIIFEAILLLALETSRFLFQNIFQFFLKELLVVIGDHVLRPVLWALYNHVIQPIVVFLYNLGYGLKRILFPIIEIFRDVMLVIAIPLRAFRLFELNWRVPSEVGVAEYRQIQQV